MTRRVVVILATIMLFSVLLVQPAAAQGPIWIGQYYDNSTLSGTAAMTRNESAISFNWGAGSPSAGIPGDGFSARFATDYVFPAGTYRFYMLADDEARVTINFQPIPLINTLGQGRAGQTVSADVQLNGSTHVQIDYATGRNVKSAKTAWRQVEHHLRELSQPRRTSAFGGVNLRA